MAEQTTETTPETPDKTTGVASRCWCGSERGPRVPADADGLGCLDDIVHANHARETRPSVPPLMPQIRRELARILDEASSTTFEAVVAWAEELLHEQREMDLAMHAAYRPEAVAEVAVHLGSHEDWDHLAAWCGGTIRHGSDPSGEGYSVLVLPNGEAGGEQSWLVLDHAGRFGFRAVVQAPTIATPATSPASAEEDFLDPRPCNGRDDRVCASLGCVEEACCTLGWQPTPPSSNSRGARPVPEQSTISPGDPAALREQVKSTTQRAVDAVYGTDPRHALLASAVADEVTLGKPLLWSLGRHFGSAGPAAPTNEPSPG